MARYLIIQTAFIGDVILATALAEKIHAQQPQAQIDFLLRKGNESLLQGHPYINKVLVWDKKRKYRSLLEIVRKVRGNRYDGVVNPHRFASSGLVSACSGAPFRSGFDKNPLSFLYTHRVKHIISQKGDPAPVHELQRNQELIAPLTDAGYALPALYPDEEARERAATYQGRPYICVAPTSVWHTKQWPAEKWAELIGRLPADRIIYLLGAPGDKPAIGSLMRMISRDEIHDLSGLLTLTASAALMAGADMNYVNDSAPMHLCTAMRAPVTAVYCSTIPEFGFWPVGPGGRVEQLPTPLYCRPCGLHGYKACPEGHFRCALDIGIEQVLPDK